jgi:putative endonuclease
MNTRKLGNFGEEIAERFLTSQNYQIVKKNYHARFGELDLIAIDRQRGQLVFVEVKTRKTEKFGPPAQILSRIKRHRLLKAALKFVSQSSRVLPRTWRFDLIGIKLDANDKVLDIEHLKNIFDG